MSLRMGSNQGSSKRNALDKRVPRNPRYAGVKSKASRQSRVGGGLQNAAQPHACILQHFTRQPSVICASAIRANCCVDVLGVHGCGMNERLLA